MTLRRRLLTERAAMTERERFNAGRLLRDVVLSLPEAQMAGTVAAYISVGTEPETRGLVYDGELLDEVPAGRRDQRVRMVARPGEGITRLR